MKPRLLAVAGVIALAALQPARADDPDGLAAYRPWGIDLSAMDTRIRPGNDFDGYASAAWYARTQIPDDQRSYGVDYEVSNRSQEQLRAIIAGNAPGSPIGDLYASFMDEGRLETLDATPLAADLATIAAAADRTALATINGATHRGFGLPLVSLYVYVDPARPVNRLYASQSGLGLPDRDYYLQPSFRQQLAAYRAYLQRSFAMIGYADPAGSAAKVLRFETAIAKLSWPKTDSRDLDKTSNPMTLAQLQAYAPGLPWSAYLRGADLGDPGTLVVAEKSAIRSLAALWNATPLDTLKAWSAVHVVDQASPWLSKRFVDSRFELTRALSGVSSLEPRWKRGGNLVDTALGEELGKEYVALHFPDAAKVEMNRMVGFLKEAMADHIERASWMSESTKRQALAKLTGMDVMVGYPDKWRDYSGLVVDANDLLGNVRRSAAFEWAYQLSDLNQAVDHGKWAMTPQTDNAYNGELENKIVFPAGILQPPYFYLEADAAVNYGSTGATIGHEISHGFDDQGRKIDSTGKLRDWWTAQDAKRFKSQAANLGRQYDRFEAAPGVFINGQLTMGENIADLAGLAIAYDAYHRSLGGREAPVIGGMTGDQRFFLGYAQSWRNQQRDDAIRQQVASDPHSPDKARANLPVRNLDAWYAAFDVRPGDALYLAPADRARLW